VRVPALLIVILMLAGCGVTAPSAAAPKATATSSASASGKPSTSGPYTHAPAMTINTHHHYFADVTTTDGVFTIELLPKAAPIAVNNFVFLARHHYYNHNVFHRIMAGFMIQTGDPTGTGFGGPGYEFKDEPVTMPYAPGVVAMANHGPNTNGSQFFIVTGPQASSLPPAYTIFGKVTRGMKVVEKISNTPVTQTPSGELSRPLKTVMMKTVVIRKTT
jgi:cyclophilin family peptidyl-prolyl cis-trans isomerase